MVKITKFNEEFEEKFNKFDIERKEQELVAKNAQKPSIESGEIHCD